MDFGASRTQPVLDQQRDHPRHPERDGSPGGSPGALHDPSPRSLWSSVMNFVRKIRGLRLGHDGSLDKLAVPLWPDVGKALGLSKNHTYDAARSGEIPTIKIGRCLRVPLAALNKMLEDAGKPKPGKN